MTTAPLRITAPGYCLLITSWTIFMTITYLWMSDPIAVKLMCGGTGLCGNYGRWGPPERPPLTESEKALAHVPEPIITAAYHQYTEAQMTLQTMDGKYILSDLRKPNEPGVDVTTLEADDPRLVTLIRDTLLIYPQPASGAHEYHLDKPWRRDFAGGAQTHVIKDRLKGKTRGFFVECGGERGEDSSNTLYLEREMAWSGVLIEPNDDNFRILQQKNRRTALINTCLSAGNSPTIAQFTSDQGLTASREYWTDYQKHVYDTQGNHLRRFVKLCLPFYSIMLALNVTHVDYFSLDIEGAEMAILRTIPFSKVDINLVSVEYNTWEGDRLNPKITEIMQSYVTFFSQLKPSYTFVKKLWLDVFFAKINN